jgi:Cu/Ag efflux protein CusF
MKHGIGSGVVVAVMAVFLGGCGDSAPTTSESSEQSGNMPQMPRSEAEGEHAAQGTVNSIDLAAGTINISHQPVESAGWPAMTMSFRLADPDAADGIETGQQIEFRFTTEGGGTVMSIVPAR